MIWQFLSWYLIIQLITIITLPLATTIFVNLADRGYAFVKSLGILLVGFVFWLGYSYGLLRNEAGGAWLAVIVVALFSAISGRQLVQSWWQEGKLPLRWRQVLLVELLFLVIFAFWAYVRAHDPAVDHTEEPMDLMFMNSIWGSPTFPPHDAWLSGYAISYYYFGYWLLTTLGRLAGQPPEIAYTLGQANWYSMLWIGCFGIVYNLLAARAARGQRPVVGGLLAALTVAFAGNPQGFLEWLYAKGVNISALARWFNVTNFPALNGDGVGQTGNWYVSFDWWWWRASRVISDRLLDGGHMEVIDEFPMFSYVLGDNHPHVTAMPIAILLIALALNLFLHKGQVALPLNQRRNVAESDEAPSATAWLPPLLRSPAAIRAFLRTAFPLGITGSVVIVITLGSLLFLNTWDFPFYWLLLGLSLGTLVWRNLAVTGLQGWERWQQTLTISGITLVAAAVLAWLLYYPYFLTAQSQAGGLMPNLFNPTRFPQFFLMFGFALFSLGALFGLLWQRLQSATAATEAGSAYRTLSITALLVYLLPLLFLAVTGFFIVGTARGRAMLDALQLHLPAGSSYGALFAQRWSTQFWTFLVIGAFLTVGLYLFWRYLHRFAGNPVTDDDTTNADSAADLFVLVLALIGLLLIFAPEFVYLRDNFGTRMNTVFKFYYQAWLLLGLTSSYVIVVIVGALGRVAVNRGPARFSAVKVGTIGAALGSLLLIGSGLFYPVMAIYSKAGGFAREPTLNSVAYLAQYSPGEWAAIAWVRANTPSDAIVLEGKGSSYASNYNRMSTVTGRQTLMGWDGHESQWRGKAFGEMAQGRDEALQTVYGNGSPEQIAQTLTQWQIDYVYVGPSERNRYGITPQSERNLATATSLVFEMGDVRIYQRRQ